VDFNLNLELLTAVLSIIMIDLVLSGDNAIIIGMAARLLPPAQQRKAIIFGALGAVGLRVLFTALVSVLLGIPLLQAVGGVVLIWIAFKLLRQSEKEHTVKEGSNLFEAIRTIILADVVMSLDNILAVGGAAHGSVALLLFGLALSMPIILFGSGLVAALMNRLPWLVYVGAGVLVYTAAEMILEDPLLSPYLPHAAWFEWGMVALLVGGVLALGHWLGVRRGPAVGRSKYEVTRVEEAQPAGPSTRH
jgi:YjbE family integral membrane protein